MCGAHGHAADKRPPNVASSDDAAQSLPVTPQAPGRGQRRGRDILRAPRPSEASPHLQAHAHTRRPLHTGTHAHTQAHTRAHTTHTRAHTTHTHTQTHTHVYMQAPGGGGEGLHTPGRASSPHGRLRAFGALSQQLTASKIRKQTPPSSGSGSGRALLPPGLMKSLVGGLQRQPLGPLLLEPLVWAGLWGLPRPAGQEHGALWRKALALFAGLGAAPLPESFP